MFCSNCGKELQDQVKFCSSCGNSVSDKKNEEVNVIEKVFIENQTMEESKISIEKSDLTYDANTLKTFSDISPYNQLENIIITVIGIILCSHQAFNYIAYIFLKHYLEIDCDLDPSILEMCSDLTNIFKIYLGWIFLFVGLFYISPTINCYKYLKEIKKLKNEGTNQACSECNFSPVSWEAKVCPSCGSPSVNHDINGYGFTFLSHILFLGGCLNSLIYSSTHHIN